MTVYSLDVLLSQFGTSLFHVWFSLLLLDLHTDFSGGRSGIPISLRIFQSFVAIHTVKGFGIVNKAEVDVFLELFCFFNDPMDVGNLMSGSSASSKCSLNIWKFMVHMLLKLAWRILSITLVACEMSVIMRYFEHSLALPFFGIGMKADLFQSFDHC